MHRATSSYLQTQVTTTTQSDVLLLLYDGAISFLQQAKERIDAKDPAGKGNLISRALDIIAELDGTLNLEKGKDLAQNLHQLYFFCSKHLLMANLKMNKDMIDEVISILGGLREAYSQIANTPEAQAAAREAGDKVAASAHPVRAQSGFVSTGTLAAASTAAMAKRQQNSYAMAMDATDAPAAAMTEDTPNAPTVDTPQEIAPAQAKALKGYKLSSI